MQTLAPDRVNSMFGTLRGTHWGPIRVARHYKPVKGVAMNRSERFHRVGIGTCWPTFSRMLFRDGPVLEMSSLPAPVYGGIHVVMPADWPYDTYWNSPGTSALGIFFDPELMESAAEDAHMSSGRLRPMASGNPFLLHVAEALMALDDAPASRVCAESLALSAVNFLLRHAMLDVNPCVRDSESKLPSAVIAKLDRYIQTRLHEPISVADLSAIANLSVFHFVRTFKKTTGLTPHAYITQRRIQLACHLMQSGSRGLAEIALECGFSEQSHFTKVFRRVIGRTPGVYRGAQRAQALIAR